MDSLQAEHSSCCFAERSNLNQVCAGGFCGWSKLSSCLGDGWWCWALLGCASPVLGSLRCGHSHARGAQHPGKEGSGVAEQSDLLGPGREMELTLMKGVWLGRAPHSCSFCSPILSNCVKLHSGFYFLCLKPLAPLPRFLPHPLRM